jgi:hypothetical protein
VIQVSSCLYRHDCGGSRETWPLLLWKLFCRRSIQVAKSSFCYKTLRYQGIYNYCCLMVWERACFQHLLLALNTIWIDLPSHLKFFISRSVVCWFVNSHSNVVCLYLQNTLILCKMYYQMICFYTGVKVASSIWEYN